LSWNNSGGFATAGIRAVGLQLHIAAALKSVFRIKICLTNKFAKYVGFVKIGA
jgi:hypothetical protein